MSALTRRQFIGAAAGLAVVANGLALPARGVTINPRSSWAVDRPPKGPLSSEDVRFLIVHHSASRNGHSGADAPAILRSFYDFHTSPEKGWNDIAYNFLIDADGGIWEGRAGSLAGPVAGDATGGNQGYTQLVCIIGDYNSAQPRAASLSSLVALLAWLADRYEVSTAPGAQISFTSRGSNLHPAGSEVVTPTITGHRTMSRTSCPGANLDSYV
ncbi:MAG TPA: N-acetylmuramoyl-L-alanine amidase, partial [Acidimicrobiia bacterium]|nr:N-acetylmuramoyl-L-alanine amidase [Acidimicrobiia bacterium]